MRSYVQRCVLYFMTTVLICLLEKVDAYGSIVRYDVSRNTERNVTFTANNREQKMWIFTHGGCENSAILFKVTHKNYKYTCPITLEIFAGQAKPVQVCGGLLGACILVKSPKSSKADLLPEHLCSSVYRTIDTNEIFPIVLTYQQVKDFSGYPQIGMDFQLLGERKLTPLTTTKAESTTAQPPTTTATKTTQTAGSQNTATQPNTTTVTERNVTKQRPRPRSQPLPPECGQAAENYNFDRILAIVFGVLLAITLVALTMVSYRLFGETRQANAGAREKAARSVDTELTGGLMNREL